MTKWLSDYPRYHDPDSRDYSMLIRRLEALEQSHWSDADVFNSYAMQVVPWIVALRNVGFDVPSLRIDYFADVEQYALIGALRGNEYAIVSAPSWRVAHVARLNTLLRALSDAVERSDGNPFARAGAFLQACLEVAIGLVRGRQDDPLRAYWKDARRNGQALRDSGIDVSVCYVLEDRYWHKVILTLAWEHDGNAYASSVSKYANGIVSDEDETVTDAMGDDERNLFLADTLVALLNEHLRAGETETAGEVAA